MSEQQDPIGGFFHENTGQALAQAVNRLIAAHPGEQFRLLPDRRLAGKPGADYLLQVDDYDFRLELIEDAGGQPRLDPERLKTAAALLEENPSTQALIYVWAAAALNAVPLSLARIRYLLQNPDRIPDLVAHTRPIEAVIEELIARQIKVWDLRADLDLEPPAQRVDLLDVFSEEVGKAIDIEMHRNYRNEERSRAAQDFPYLEEKQLLMSTLQDALKGAETPLLIERLLRMQPGSDQ